MIVMDLAFCLACHLNATHATVVYVAFRNLDCLGLLFDVNARAADTGDVAFQNLQTDVNLHSLQPEFDQSGSSIKKENKMRG